MKKFKGHLSVPSNPSTRPIRPIKLGATRLVCKLRWTPKGECRGLVETSAAMIKMTPVRVFQKRTFSPTKRKVTYLL